MVINEQRRVHSVLIALVRATTDDVAAILGTADGWVHQLAERDFLPAEQARGR